MANRYFLLNLFLMLGLHTNFDLSRFAFPDTFIPNFTLPSFPGSNLCKGSTGLYGALKPGPFGASFKQVAQYNFAIFVRGKVSTWIFPIHFLKEHWTPHYYAQDGGRALGPA